MILEELKQEHEKAKHPNTQYIDHMAFIKKMVASNEDSIVNFHYNLMKDRSNRKLHQRIRYSFFKRGKVAEAFLLKAIETENDDLLLSDTIFILGLLRNKSARKSAIQHILSKNEELRHTACVVLGWVGTIKDTREILYDRLINDASTWIRGDAATAHRQVWHRIPKVKETALQNLKTALSNDDEEMDVMASIIITIQDIAQKRLGLKENIDGAEILGDVPTARKNALKALAKITKR